MPLSNLSANAHVADYLRDYLAERRNLNYAVVLNGAWGSGKTHFIRAYFDASAETKPSCFYVSLFGLKSADEICTAIGLQALAYEEADEKAGLNLLKHGQKLLKRHKDFVGRLSEALEALNPQYAAGISALLRHKKVPLEVAIVLDDIERASMPMVEILAAVNHYVEHGGNKVILLVNETEIKSDEQTLYENQKEKVVGKVLRITPDIEVALDRFFDEFKSDPVALSFFTDRRADIIEVYQSSQIHNLRVLQQSLWLFKKFLGTIPASCLEFPDGLTRVFRLLLALSFEFTDKDLTDAAYPHRSTHAHPSQRKEQDSQSFEHQFNKRNKKYFGIDLRDPVLSNETVQKILDDGHFDLQAIEHDLNQSGLFTKPAEEEPWRTIYHWEWRTNEAVQRAANALEARFHERKYNTLLDLLNIAAIRLWLSEITLLPKDKTQLMKEHCDYVDYLAQNNLLAYQSVGRPVTLKGLVNKQNFFRGKGLGKVTDAHLEVLVARGDQHLHTAYGSMLQSFAADFLTPHAPDKSGETRLSASKAIGVVLEIEDEFLHLIGVPQFVDRLDELSPAHQYDLLLALQHRLMTQTASPASKEIVWLSKVREALEAKWQGTPLGKARFARYADVIFDPLTSFPEKS